MCKNVLAVCLITLFLKSRKPLLAKEMAHELVKLKQMLEDRRDSRPIARKLRLCS
jgi:hypothetical protein